ncbi:UDP-N-acetylglucosaminyltransferase transferase [Listeria aquatica FSL S10-1188]|uniref:UDP-N-acetylglucosaminyltransferase transferase n=1 Tax=Listeria aquatica FSL S10-1188 TaxID=1265818 RepID=W7BA83_9LIST|nr:UDP-N-acetylglucosaminyltransferase transferase [Listeria aquatica FSL S10-1188]
MGDTGALFLGFLISILSVMGFKNVTFISLIVPILILGVPISDTIIAIIRRIVTKQPLAMADKSHIHHQLMGLGFTHRQTVILIYAISALFFPLFFSFHDVDGLGFRFTYGYFIVACRGFDRITWFNRTKL